TEITAPPTENTYSRKENTKDQKYNRILMLGREAFVEHISGGGLKDKDWDREDGSGS
ncbi:hypothetical protein HDU99_008681, partial [Rhizoclosmatium hyalinum]